MQQRAQQSMESILTAAEYSFSEFGYYGARVDDIAEQAGVNKALIYKYFGNKEKLYKTVFDIVYNRFTELERKVLTIKGLDYKEKIRKFVAMEFDFCNNNRSYVRMIMWENLNSPDMSLSVSGQSKKPVLDILRQIIDEVKPGCIDEYDFLLTLYSCCFFYFTNINTMSGIVGKDLSELSNINHRIDVVSELLIKYLEAFK